MVWMDMDSLAQQLLRNAYLFEDPDSYQAGVLDTLAMFEDWSDEQADDTESVRRSR